MTHTRPNRRDPAAAPGSRAPRAEPRIPGSPEGSSGSPSLGARPEAAGWHGWDDYAEFYDWENRRTMGLRDVRFWQDFARQAGGPVLELGCGTARVTAPLGRTGVRVVGVDRSAAMLARARRRLRRRALRARVDLVRADITMLPFPAGTFAGIVAPYGILQSLLSDRALTATLTSARAALRPGGRLGLELVPDVPRWRETGRHVSLVGLSGPNGLPVTLIESVRQDRARRLTIFDQQFVEGTGTFRRTLNLTIRFRTLSVKAMVRRLERAGLRIDVVAGGYRGEPWSEHADTWIILASRP